MPPVLRRLPSFRFAQLGRPLFALWFVLRAWGRLLLTSAMLVVMLLSPSSWRAQTPGHVAHAVVRAVWPLLGQFTLGLTLFAALVMPILRSTLQSLGLAQLGSDILVRLFLAELLPWACAFAVLLKQALPQSAQLCRQTRGHDTSALTATPLHPSRFIAALPQLLAALFCMGLLFVCGALLLLALDHGISHGLNLWAVGDHAAHIGHIFTPAFSLVLVLKVLLFAGCTAVFPMAAYVAEYSAAQHNSDVQLRSLVRVILSLSLLDVLALLAWYA